MKTLADFESALEAGPAWSPALRALWLDRKGLWGDAHAEVQDDESTAGAWVHAYLHRKEGDQGNARYWYGRAGRDVCALSAEQEWAAIASALLKEDRE